MQRNHRWRDNVPGRENLPAQTLSKAASVLNYSVIYTQDDFWVESLLRHPGLEFSEVLLVGIVSARHFFLPEERVLPLWGPKQGAELLGEKNKSIKLNRDSLSYVACPDFIPCSAPSPGCGWADAGILCHCDSGRRWSGTVPWGCPALTLPFPARYQLRLLVGTMAGQRQLVLPLQGNGGSASAASILGRSIKGSWSPGEAAGAGIGFWWSQSSPLHSRPAALHPGSALWHLGPSCHSR